MTLRRAPWMLALPLLTLAACAVAPDDGADEAAAGEAVGRSTSELSWTIGVSSFSDYAPSQTAEVSRVITSEAQYRALVGHAPPVTIDWAREWVVFYSAGSRPTGGYEAEIERVSLEVNWWTAPHLLVTTQLTRPGPTCIVTQMFTVPQAFAKLTRPVLAPRYALSQHGQRMRACAFENPCAAVTCPTNATCEVQNGKGVCVPRCGGFPGFDCPGNGTCVEAASPGCDPSNGGVDCLGLCRCIENVLCVQGFHWDGAPTVCGCVHD